jgi:hypothetical protein
MFGLHVLPTVLIAAGLAGLVVAYVMLRRHARKTGIKPSAKMRRAFFAPALVLAVFFAVGGLSYEAQLRSAENQMRDKLQQADVEVVSFGPLVTSAVLRKGGCTAEFDLHFMGSRSYKGEWPVYLETGKAVSGCPNDLAQLFGPPKK